MASSLTRSPGRLFFGDGDPIGRTVLVQRRGRRSGGASEGHPGGDRGHAPGDAPPAVQAVRVGSRRGLAARGCRPISPAILGFLDVLPRLRPDARAGDFASALPAFAGRHNSARTPTSYRIEPLRELHFTADARTVNARIAAVGVLILIVAGINFVTLVTARATRQAVEVGVRKSVGARRVDLIIQFFGEALIYVLLALLLSVVLVKIALPSVNALIERTIAFDPFANLAVAAAIAGAALLIAVIAGFYPAFVLSSFGPASALRTGGEVGSSRVRRGARRRSVRHPGRTDHRRRDDLTADVVRPGKRAEAERGSGALDRCALRTSPQGSTGGGEWSARRHLCFVSSHE